MSETATTTKSSHVAGATIAVAEIAVVFALTLLSFERFKACLRFRNFGPLGRRTCSASYFAGSL